MVHIPALPENLPTGDLPQPASLGAIALGNGQCQFTVWAPHAQQVEVHILQRSSQAGPSRAERYLPLQRDAQGYHRTLADDVLPGDRYLYRLDGHNERPDPASRYQPTGVHEASQVVDPQFAWEDGDWHGLPLDDYIIYELHVGTYTPDGTFDAIIPHLDMLKELGITALELLPVAQCPGNRNWGYDGVYLFAVQQSYGGPDGLKRLVNACHERGLAVVLDVVYNHLGPEGNYLWDYGHYFTDAYHTPWGAAVNFDQRYSDEVRRYFLENVLYWISEFHIDALRLDAVHAIRDFSARPFLQELATAVQQQAAHMGRQVYTIAESDLNDTRIIRSQEQGGFGLDSQWSDDFHHAVHTLLTGEHSGYYVDYGTIDDLATTLRGGYLFAGQFSITRQRRHGNSPHAMAANKFVVCIQNHDQVGNRMRGDRLSDLVSFAQLKLGAGLMLFSPFIPMLFMGEEYAETAPFQYFVSHGDPGLIEAVRNGRKEEFATFAWQGEVPDPQSEETFRRSQLNHDLRQSGSHRVLFDWYRELIGLRKRLPALANLSKQDMQVDSFGAGPTLFVRRWHAGHDLFFVAHFGGEPTTITLPIPAGEWARVCDSAEARWQPTPDALAQPQPERIQSTGEQTVTLAPHTIALFERIA